MTLHWWSKPRTISIVVDNDSWMQEYAARLIGWCQHNGDDAFLVRHHQDIRSGGVALFLGCTKIAAADILARNYRNLVIHESGLPQGRGFAPMAWQIIEGKSEIPVCLVEMTDIADAGPIIYQDSIKLEGHELNAEWRHMQGDMTISLCQRYLSEPSPPDGHQQLGAATVYPRRRPTDSRLDPTKTLEEQFDLLRTVHNDQYPAFFDFRGHRYKITIEKIKD